MSETRPPTEPEGAPGASRWPTPGRRHARAQRLALRVLAVVSVALLADSLFLVLADAPDRVLAWAIRLHVWLGLAFGVLLALYAWPHFLLHRRHGNARARANGFLLLGLLGLGTALGTLLTILGSSAETRWLLYAHEAVFLAAIAGYLFHRLSARSTPALRIEVGGAALALLLAAGAWGLDRFGWVGQEAASPPTAQAEIGATRSRIADGHWLSEDDLTDTEYCARCHGEIHEQWEASAHHFSSMNDPFYAATFAVMQRDRDVEAAHFCAGCHDPAVLLTGNAQDTITEETTNAQAGITCLACHAIVEVPDTIGNAGYVIAEPEHYPYFDSEDPAEQEINERMIRSRPEAHKAAFLKDFHATSEFCLACHKAHLPEEVTLYRWKRGQNDYDPWFESAAAMKSARTFYDGEEVKECQDCHMPQVETDDPAAGPDGTTADHGMFGANTAMAMLTGKERWMETAVESLEDSVSVDLFLAAVDPDGEDEVLQWPLDDPAVRVPAGRPLRLDVVVRNREAGHMWPGGTLDLLEPYLELTVADGSGRALLASGRLDETGRLDPSAHRFHNVLLSREGRKIDIHDVENVYTLLYNHAIPLGASDVLRYELIVPEELKGGTMRVTAEVKYRKFPREYTEFALGPNAPRMPITLVASDEVELAIGEPANPAPGETAPVTDPEDDALAWRLNDYGIAHLRQGDSGTAGWAFQEVSERMPSYAGGPTNRARVHLAEGALGPMEEALREADRLAPGHPRTAYFLGRLRAAQGRFAEAIDAYRVTLESFPEDREALRRLGIALYKGERYGEAIEAFEAVLAIDAEDVTANSYMARSLRALGDPEGADAYEQKALRYKDDPAEQSVTEIYRRNEPDADREANRRHVHPLHPVGDEG